MGFWMRNTKENLTFNTNEVVDKNSEDSDQGGFDEMALRRMDLDEEIKAIFTTKSSCDYSYIAILSSYRFKIIYVYEEPTQGCEIDVMWDNYYQFDKEMIKYGQITSLDFFTNISGFMAGTNKGYVL